MCVCVCVCVCVYTGLLGRQVYVRGFPGDSDGKESACNVGDPGAMWEPQIQSLGREDPLEKGMATHSSILAWRIPWTEEPGGLHGVTKSLT